MVMSRFELNEAQTAAFVTNNFLDLQEFDSLTAQQKESALAFIKETIHSQLTCCRKGLWDQFLHWIPSPIRRMAQRHIHPVVPGEDTPEYQLPEGVQSEFEVLNELAWLLLWKHKKASPEVPEEDLHHMEKQDLERVQHIREHILPHLHEKIIRLEKSSS